MFTTLTVMLLVVGFLVWKTCVVVQTREACVVERLGKFRIVLEPGFHFLIPFFDRIAYRHEMREQVLHIPSQSCITRDNIQVEVDGLVYVKVTDPERASYGIEDYIRATINLAQTTMRAEVGKLSLGETFSERDALNETIVKEIDKASDPWGVKIMRYELKNITPSEHVMMTLEKEMEAEREKRAAIVNADAQRTARVNQSQGHRQAEINISEGDRQRRINEAEGRARSIAIVAEATAEGTEMIGRATQNPGGPEAVKAQLVGHFIDTLGKITSTAEVSVVPLQLATLQGFFQGIGQVGDSMSDNTAAPVAKPSPGPWDATGR